MREPEDAVTVVILMTWSGVLAGQLVFFRVGDVYPAPAPALPY